MEKRRELIKGFMDTIPLGISCSIYGLVYGVLGAKAGLSVMAVGAMSAFIFAGSSQIAVVQMIAQGGAAPFSVILTVLIMNLRHTLMSASLSSSLKKTPRRMKMLNAYFLTDESYAVTYAHFQKHEPSSMYFLGSGLNIYVFWGLAGVLGYFSGNVIPPALNPVFDFAFAAAFIGMLVPTVKDMPVLLSVLVSAVVSLLGSLYFPGKLYIIFAGITGSLAGYFASSMKKVEKEASQECKEVIEGE